MIAKTANNYISQVADCMYSHVVSSQQYKRLAGNFSRLIKTN